MHRLVWFCHLCHGKVSNGTNVSSSANVAAAAAAAAPTAAAAARTHHSKTLCLVGIPPVAIPAACIRCSTFLLNVGALQLEVS